MTGDERDGSISETQAELQGNIDAMKRTWRRYGLPSVLLAWLAIGLWLCTVIYP